MCVFRRMNMKYILSILAFLFLCFPVQAAEWKDISYGSLSKQKLDIYVTEGMKNAPVMVFVHGGGWVIGNKSRVHYKPRAFNEAGFLFISVGYPLLPDHPVDEQAQSIAKAVKWISNNISRYGGDPSQMHIMGHSAGAHLAALVAVDPQYLGNFRKGEHVLQTVISIDGASLNIDWRMRNLDSVPRMAKRMFKRAFGDDPKYWQSLSPFHRLDEKNDIPDFLFLTAVDRADSNVAADGFSQKLKSLDVKNSVIRIADRTHSSINKKMGTKGDKAFMAILDFIR